MRIAVVSPGFYDHAGRVQIPALQDTFHYLSSFAFLDYFVVPPELGPRPDWVQPWKVWQARGAYDVAWILWPHRTARAALQLRALQPCLPQVVSIMGAEATTHHGLDLLRARSAWNGARFVTCGSGWLAERVRARFAELGSRLRVVPLRRDVSVGSSEPGPIVALSSLQPVKRPELLLDIMQALPEERLDIYGWSLPEAADDFRRLISSRGLDSRVRYCGFVSASETLSALRSAQVLLHTSQHEAQGVAFIEAAALGVPIVCEDVGVAALLRADGATVEFASGDIESWVASIRRARGARTSGVVRPPGDWQALFKHAVRRR